jgi:hypothetical protein
MHPYGIDSNERRNVLIVLVLASILLGEASGRFAAGQGWILTAPLDWIFDPASGAAWFAVLFYLFENYLWRWNLLHRVGFVQIPNLNGRWAGTLRSSYDAFATTHQIAVTIKQSWTVLVVELTTAQSSSRSDTGSVYIKSAAEPILVYTYLNDPNPDQPESLQMHSGTTTLQLRDSSNGKQLVGRYYSGRGRGNHGELMITRSI